MSYTVYGTFTACCMAPQQHGLIVCCVGAVCECVHLTANSERCRHNQALEQDSLAMHEEKLRLENEADMLAKRLAAIMKDKQAPHSNDFDAETPIDKVLNVLQSYVEKVWHFAYLCGFRRQTCIGSR